MKLSSYALIALNKALAPFEDPIGTERPLWRDYSRYQEIVDFIVAVSNGVRGMAARSSIGSAYKDPFFVTNYAGAKSVGIYRTSYHVVYPNLTAQANAKNWYEAHPERDIIARVIDLELQNGVTFKQIADVVWELSNIVLSRDGVRPIIHSRYMLVNQWLVPFWTCEMLNEHLWWLAQYMFDRTREHPGPPTLPTGVLRERVILHQTADKKVAPAGEVTGSISVDWDRWEIGNEALMHLWIKDKWGGGVPPPLPPPIEYSYIGKASVGVNVRAQPSVNSEDLGGHVAGTEVPVVEETPDWARIDGWVSKISLKPDRFL